MIFLEQVQRFGDSRVALIGFPSAGTFGSKLPLLSCMFEEYMACVRQQAMVCKRQMSPTKSKLHFDVEELHQTACKLEIIFYPGFFSGLTNLDGNVQNPFHPKKY